MANVYAQQAQNLDAQGALLKPFYDAPQPASYCALMRDLQLQGYRYIGGVSEAGTLRTSWLCPDDVSVFHVSCKAEG